MTEPNLQYEVGVGAGMGSWGTRVIFLLKPVCILTPASPSLKTSSVFILTEAKAERRFKAWLGLSNNCSGLVLWTPLSAHGLFSLV